MLDLSTVPPLDQEATCKAVSRTGCLLVVDKDYVKPGFSGELAAVVLEVGIPKRYDKVCTEDMIQYSHELEDQMRARKTMRLIEIESEKEINEKQIVKLLISI